MNLISQSEAARIAGVKRQAIHNIKKEGTYNFFEGSKVNTDSQHWKAYLKNRECSVQGKPKPIENKISIKNNIKDNVINIKNSFSKKDKQSSKKKSDSKNKKQDRESDQQKYSFTGGVNPDSNIFIPQNISDIKRLAEIQKIAMEMKIRSGELIERTIVADMMDVLGRVVQSYFVDLPRRFSTQICQMTDSVGLEKKIEELLNKPIQQGIQEFKKVAMKACKVKVKK